jgi:hypothetical protein
VSTGRRSILIALAAITVWYGGTLAFWALRPLHDWVPVGVDYSVQPPKQISVEVECNTVFESSPRDSTPLPALTPQPDKAPALDYQREPCELVHSQAQTLLVVDTAAAVVLYGIAGWLMLRGRKSRARAGHAALAV